MENALQQGAPKLPHISYEGGIYRALISLPGIELPLEVTLHGVKNEEEALTAIKGYESFMNPELTSATITA